MSKKVFYTLSFLVVLGLTYKASIFVFPVLTVLFSIWLGWLLEKGYVVFTTQVNKIKFLGHTALFFVVTFLLWGFLGMLVTHADIKKNLFTGECKVVQGMSSWWYIKDEGCYKLITPSEIN